MPQKTYEVTAPDGRVFEVDGDHQPTEPELTAIFKQMGVKATPTTVSQGTWEDRGIGGKVWHPAIAPAAQRKDANVVGIGSGSQSTEPDAMALAPEVVGPAAMQVGTAVVAPGLRAAGRVMAGATATAGQAAPIIGYEGTHFALKKAGVPEPFASIGAGIVGLRLVRGARAAAQEGEVTTGTTATGHVLPQTPMNPPEGMTPAGFPRPTTTPETPLELTRRVRAEWRAANPGAAPTRVEVPAAEVLPAPTPEALTQERAVFFNPKSFMNPAAGVEGAAKAPKLTAEEMKVGARLLKSGLTAQETLQTILKQREAVAALQQSSAFRGLPSSAEVATAVRDRNATGRWPD